MLLFLKDSGFLFLKCFLYSILLKVYYFPSKYWITTHLKKIPIYTISQENRYGVHLPKVWIPKIHPIGTLSCPTSNPHPTPAALCPILADILCSGTGYTSQKNM